MFTRQPPEQRLLVGAPATVRATFYDQDGAPTSASGSVVVSIDRADGTAVVTSASTAEGGQGVYTAALGAQSVSLLDQYECRWYEAGTLRTTTHVEIVGGYYFTIDQARASDPTLAKTANLTDADILQARTEVEWQVEQITKAAWVPRYGEELVRHDCEHDPRTVLLRDPEIRNVRSVTPTNGTAFTAAQCAALELDGYLVRIPTNGTTLFPPDTIRVAYEYGYNAPPADLRKAALRHLRHQLNAARGIDERTITKTDEFGTTQFAVPGRNGSETGLPECDAVYARYMHSPQVIG